MKRIVQLAGKLGIAMTAAILPAIAAAQAWPERPIKVVVGFNAGAGTDALARALADKLASRVGQPVVVENKPGASGMLAANFVGNAPADGHTLLVTPVTAVITPHVSPSSGNVDVLTDLVPVSQLTSGTLLLVASADSGARNAKELTALAKKEPRSTYGTAGNGTPMHIAGKLYEVAAGIELTHVPYKGTAPALTDLMGGHVKMAFSSLAAVRPYLESGKLVPIGVIQKTRSPLLPEVPTMTEQGVPGIELTTWFGLFASKGTPEAVVSKINHEVNAILAMPEIKKLYQAMGEEPTGGTPAEFAKLVRSDYDFYGKVIRDLGIAQEGKAVAKAQ